MKKILMSAAALLLSAVGAYAAQQKYYFLYEEGHISFMRRDMRISLKPVGLSLTVRLKNTFLTLVEMMS